MFLENRSYPLTRCHANELKYADDGNVAITHIDHHICHNLAQEDCLLLSNWCKKWRLVSIVTKIKQNALSLNQRHLTQNAFNGMTPLLFGKKFTGYTDSTIVLGLKKEDQLTCKYETSTVLVLMVQINKKLYKVSWTQYKFDGYPV